MEFTSLFSCSGQDLATSATAKELLVDKVERGSHQGDDVGTSAVGELTRTKDKANTLFVCFWLM